RSDSGRREKTDRSHADSDTERVESLKIGPGGKTDMSIIGWILLGLISGFIASKIVNKQGEGCIFNTVLGLVGALVVGVFISPPPGHQKVTVFNFYSFLVAIVGAVVVLFLYHAITGRRPLR